MTSSPDAPESFQIPIDAAEFYESAFVPAFFAQWAPILCDAAGVTSDQRVLDVACGTGIVTRTAADLVGSGGSVVGLDPFSDRTFDIVVSQMALMFFPERLAALREMARVVVDGGTVPGALGAQAAFAPFVEMASRFAGPEATALLGTYFACGDLDALAALIESAGLHVTTARTQVGTYRAPSVDAFVTTEVESTPLIEHINDDVYRRIRSEAPDVLSPFVTLGGSVEAPFETNIVVALRL